VRARITEVQEAVHHVDRWILDARPLSDYCSGHIPTAIHVDFSDNLRSGEGTLLPPQQLAAVYRQAGLRPEHPVITSCGGGFAGALTWFVLYQLGYENIRLYDGSWMEWSSQDGPVERCP